MSTRKDIQEAVDWLNILAKFPDSEGAEIWHAVYCLDQIDGQRPDLDKKYVKYLRRAAPLTYEWPEPKGSWRWQAHEIIEGKYPLELLPEHVRKLAQKLYYRRKK